MSLSKNCSKVLKVWPSFYCLNRYVWKVIFMLLFVKLGDFGSTPTFLIGCAGVRTDTSWCCTVFLKVLLRISLRFLTKVVLSALAKGLTSEKVSDFNVLKWYWCIQLRLFILYMLHFVRRVTSNPYFRTLLYLTVPNCVAQTNIFCSCFVITVLVFCF